LLAKKQWRRVFEPQLLILVPLLIGLILTPMLIGLYEQHGHTGLRFYFWTQSFGRLTGENSWRNDTSALFFLHTFPWLFAPWGLVAAAGIARLGRSFCLGQRSASHALVLGSFVPPLLAISASHYKLPHYATVLFPAAALLAAHEIESWRLTQRRKWVPVVQGATAVLLIAAATFLLAVFPSANLWRLGILVMLALTMVAAVRVAPTSERIVLALPAASVVFGMGALNLHVTPALLEYQSTRAAVARSSTAGVQLFYHRTGEPSLHFAARRVVPAWDGERSGGAEWIYTDRDGLSDIRRAFGGVQVIDSFPHVHVTRLTGRFLWPPTRGRATSWRFLVTPPQPVASAIGSKAKK
jgi:4-amino-4-deoxy-L-arabinose transferase-like glycosyltransferase